MKALVLNLWQKVNQPKLYLILPFFLISLILIIIPLIIVIVYAISPVANYSTSVNFQVFDQSTFQAIGRSLWLAIVTTLLCLLIAYPFAYFLHFSNSPIFKTLVIVIISAPIWSSFLIKIIGLKSLLDLLNGGANSTFGEGYTLLGLVYIYLPFSIMPLYSVLVQMPKNIINASLDLNHKRLSTFFNVVFPYTFNAMMSAIILVFLPSFTTVAVGAFLDNYNGHDLIGVVNYDLGIAGLDSKIALARSSALSLIISLLMFGIYGLIVLIPKFYLVLSAYNKKVAFQEQFHKIHRTYCQLVKWHHKRKGRTAHGN